MQSILSTSQWNDVQHHCLKADKGTWVIWDVDNTLIFSNDTAFCCHDDIYKQQLKSIEAHEKNKLSYLEMKDLWYEIRLNLPSFLIDKQIPTTIKQLQSKNIVTFALTYMLACTRKHDCIAWRTQQLNALGIDFSITSPLKENFQFKTLPHHYPIGYPTLANGIFHTHNCSKGKCLEQLLEKTKNKPKKIIFIDDAIKNINDVAQTAETFQVNFLGIEFSAYAILNPQGSQLDPTLLKRWDIFKATNKWLTSPVNTVFYL